MRPLRFLLALMAFILTFILLLSASRWRSAARSSAIMSRQRGSVSPYFDWRSPSSLFPPSAIISLTDDNTTFFIARPAAFGPDLPLDSLSAPLWVGSGFSDPGAEGELGCSDIPGWEGGSGSSTTSASFSSEIGKLYRSSDKGDRPVDGKRRKRSITLDNDGDDRATEGILLEADGTDDHLHHPLSFSNSLDPNSPGTRKPTHADIQSMQEAAEITGKVVLLSRGGCGFLEKVKWAQRRGGVAVIVGDDVPGGDLIIMYARGDTSNVTIPAVFTSHTTAHLLSSLIPQGNSQPDDWTGDSSRLGLAAGRNSGLRIPTKDKHNDDRPVFTKTKIGSETKATPAAKMPSQRSREHKTSPKTENNADGHHGETGWFKSIFGFGSTKSLDSDRSRPPSSGNLDWVLQEDFDEKEAPGDAKHRATTTAPNHSTSTKQPKEGGDGFVIGVQDWRDPDLVAEQKERLTASTNSASSTSSEMRPARSKAVTSAKLEGGSIMPGSGEYVKSPHEASNLGSGGNKDASANNGKQDLTKSSETGTDRNWISKLLHPSTEKDSDSLGETDDNRSFNSRPSIGRPDSSSQADNRHHLAADPDTEHDGLWVTLSPSAVSSSTFFDTLLVLVVSPLITLTVVYALLLLRSRIRRRRWRAPKSVVERLPVRTYQTMTSNSTPPSESSSVSPSSMTVSPLGPTTPLLTSTGEPTTSANLSNHQHRHSRPRSRTASASLPHSSSLRSRSSSPSTSPTRNEQTEMALEEKRAAGLAEWRRRYGGKQRECVVCLEEYVDGVSRVMSLPCGHEFHEGCITPWLTTRRRTCPICKGDVVRSLARATPMFSSPPAASSSSQPTASSPLLHSHFPPDAQLEPYTDNPSSTSQEQEPDLESGLIGSTQSSLSPSEAEE